VNATNVLHKCGVPLPTTDSRSRDSQISRTRRIELRGQFDFASQNYFFSRSHKAVIRVYDELVDTLTRFLPNSASLGRSSIRRRTFPARSLRLFLTCHRRIQHGGERKRPMNPFIQLKTVTPVFVVTLVCVGLLPTMRAVSPAQEGGYAGGNTAEGQNALPSLNGGI